MKMIHTLIVLKVLVGAVVFAEPINRAKIWTDVEVDTQARKWGEEVAQEQGARAQHEALAEWREDILNCDELPVNERIELLGSALRKISQFSRFQVSERIEIYDMARTKMASIPGHAKYFTDKIEEAYESNAERVRTFEGQPEWKAALEKAKQTGEVSEGIFNLVGGMWGDYGEIRSENLGMLGHIPSAESVRALGHYLRERDEPDIKIHSPDTGRPAAESLTGLITDGPMQTWMASYEDVPKWQKWFDEVKAGKRTFRFVGSNVEYTLDGPADARTLERIKNKVAGVQRSAAKREHATKPGAQAATNSKGPALYAGLIAATLLCLSVLVFFYKRWNQQR
jgi:hypothetical protein